jgi:hypothetical protein
VSFKWQWLLVLTFELVACAAPGPPAKVNPPVSTVDTSTSSAPVVDVNGGLTDQANVGGDVVLYVDVTNVGSSSIDQVTVVVNDAFLSQMSVQETTPSSIRHNEQGGEYFAFDSLPPGKTGRYVIHLVPRTAGQFTATVDVANWSPVDMWPLPTRDGGLAELTFFTDVLTRRDE